MILKKKYVAIILIIAAIIFNFTTVGFAQDSLVATGEVKTTLPSSTPLWLSQFIGNKVKGGYIVGSQGIWVEFEGELAYVDQSGIVVKNSGMGVFVSRRNFAEAYFPFGSLIYVEVKK